MNLEEAYPRQHPLPRKPQWIAVIGLTILICFFVATLVTPNVSNGHGVAKISQAKSDIATLCSGIDAFRLDCNRFPTSKEGFEALRRQPNGVSEWHGASLIDEPPMDPWGNPYQYRTAGPKGRGYQVESYGADGEPGGEGDNADIIGGSDS